MECQYIWNGETVTPHIFKRMIIVVMKYINNIRMAFLAAN